MSAINVEVSVSQMKAYLAEGKSRKEIAQTLGVPQKVVNQIFQHPELKAKKKAKLYNVVFAPEGVEQGINGSAPVSEQEVVSGDDVVEGSPVREEGTASQAEEPVATDENW